MQVVPVIHSPALLFGLPAFRGSIVRLDALGIPLGIGSGASPDTLDAPASIAAFVSRIKREIGHWLLHGAVMAPNFGEAGIRLVIGLFGCVMLLGHCAGAGLADISKSISIGWAAVEFGDGLDCKTGDTGFHYPSYYNQYQLV